MTRPSEVPSKITLDGLSDWMGTILRYRSDHPAAVHILDVLERLLDRPYRTHVLIHGEPGTGKEGLARALHAAMHPGGEAPFVKIPSGGRDPAVLCRHLFGAEGHPGAIDRAEGGTLFLDEVATLPREVQARLAPALRGRFRRDDDEEPRRCRLCVIGATDHDLRARVDSGDFRHDLYYRLARIRLHVPPLRERPSDLPRAAIWVANHILASHGLERSVVLEGEHEPADLVLTKDAVDRLLAHDWRGNFRELDQVVERALMLYREGDRIDVAAIRRALSDPTG